MFYPKLDTLRQKAVTIHTFGGYNHTLDVAQGEFYDMENLTSDGGPVLMPRQGRKAVAQTTSGNLIVKDGLCYVNQTTLVINGYAVELGLTPGQKQLVSMGAYVVIFPDKKYVNTLDYADKGGLEARFVSQGAVGFSLCHRDGTALTGVTVAEDVPEDPANLAWWLDTGTGELKQYSAPAETWVTQEETYVRIAATGIGAAFREGDGITISGVAAQSLQTLNGSACIQARGEDFVVIPGMIQNAVTQEPDQGPVTLERTVPDMDFVVEADNRLWGCRYGPDRQGNIVNTLYACKLGDFKNWHCYQGLSTDSYAVSLGADGPFTGAVTYLGQPTFFRQDCLHKVYGSYPAAYRIQTTVCRGVEKNSGRSLAIVDEVLYYLSPEGVCAYDGSLPVCVSRKLGTRGFHHGVAGSRGSKFYISLLDRQEKAHLFVYDTRQKLWHREDDFRPLAFCCCDDQLFACDGKILWQLTGDGEETVSWMAQTGPLSPRDPHRRYISRITPRLYLEPGSRLRFYARYDGRGSWEPLATVGASSLRSFRLPLRPRRCDFLELQIRGTGKCKLYSLTLTLEQGSDGP